MEFRQFKALIQSNFSAMTAAQPQLFEVTAGGDEEQVAAFKERMWNVYLDSFPPGTNEIYRERREYDCSCCRQFIKGIGNAVIIEDGAIRTVWDLQTGDEKFQPVADTLAAFIKSHAITDIYVTKEAKVGTDYNHELYNDGTMKKWEHFFLMLPNHYVDRSSKSVAEIKGEVRNGVGVFSRGLSELTQEALLTVRELIAQNSLYKGEEWKSNIDEFLTLHQAYSRLDSEEAKQNFVWDKIKKTRPSVALIRNTSMGTLLVDISKGEELDAAVRSYERIVAPANYKRPKAIFTQKMLDDAKNTITELGYLDSLPRRHATLDDINVTNILFSNKDAAKRVVGAADVFAEMSSGIPTDPKKFSKTEEISVEKFLSDILPTATDLEILLENKHAPSMVSLTAPVNAEAPTMFKWPNPFAWGYSGNITDSDLKQNVKSAGGNVDGIMRFSIQWNDQSGAHDGNDLDAHAKEPGGYEIYYGNRSMKSPCGGQLDVDIISPRTGVPAVENIVWTDESRLKEGTYPMIVNCFSNNGGRGGFRAEIEVNGEIHTFDYQKSLRQKENVVVAEVTYSKANGFTVKNLLPSTVSSRDVWGLKTNQFVPVSVVMYSPNYWDDQQGIGHKHYFFMLKDCVNPEQPNGFYNEFLKPELEKHKRVFEALGGKMAVQYVDDQLSGIGFSSTKRGSLTVKVKGQTERVVKVLF